jgi:hypothetical protein
LKSETNREKLLGMMASEEELEKLTVGSDLVAKRDTGPVSPIEDDVAEDLAPNGTK